MGLGKDQSEEEGVSVLARARVRLYYNRYYLLLGGYRVFQIYGNGPERGEEEVVEVVKRPNARTRARPGTAGEEDIRT